jgi:hypothetical protein
VRGGATFANKPYIVACGLPGHTPGTILPGGLLPLRWDPLSDIVLGLALAKSAAVPGFVGTLDAIGRGSPTFKLSTFSPGPAALGGQRLTFAAWVYTATTNLTGTGSAPLDVVFR